MHAFVKDTVSALFGGVVSGAYAHNLHVHVEHSPIHFKTPSVLTMNKTMFRQGCLEDSEQFESFKKNECGSTGSQCRAHAPPRLASPPSRASGAARELVRGAGAHSDSVTYIKAVS